MNRPLRALCLSSLLVLGCSFAARAADPLEAYPDTVAVVIRFDSVDRFVGSVHEMLGAVGPGAAAAAGEFEGEVIGKMLELDDRTDVLDRTAPVYVGLFPFQAGPPSAMLVKATDKDALLKGLMRTDDLDEVGSEKLANGFTRYTGGAPPVFLARWNDYWIYTRKEQVADALDLNSKDRRTMADVLDMRARGVFDGGDAALAINSAHLAAKFKTEIQRAKEQLFENIDALPEEQLGGNAEAARKIYKGLAGVGFDALFDSTWAVGHVDLSAEGGQLEALAGVREETKTDKLLAENPASPLETLGLLPAEAPIYFGMALDYSRFLEEWTQAAYLSMAKDKAEAEAAAKLLAEAKVQSSVVSYALPEKEEGGIVACTLQQTEDAGKLREGFRRFIKNSEPNKTPLFTMSFDMKEDAEKYKQHAIDIMSMKFELAGGSELAPFDAFYKTLFGGEALQMRITSVGPLFVEATGNDASQIRRLLDGVTEGEGVVALNAAYGKTRDKLADEANVLLLIDAPRTVTDFVRLLSRVEIVAGGLRAAPFNFSIKPAPSYSGVSLGTEPQSLRLKAFVPVEQTRGMLQIFAPGL